MAKSSGSTPCLRSTERRVSLMDVGEAPPVPASSPVAARSLGDLPGRLRGGLGEERDRPHRARLPAGSRTGLLGREGGESTLGARLLGRVAQPPEAPRADPGVQPQGEATGFGLLLLEGLGTPAEVRRGRADVLVRALETGVLGRVPKGQ